MRLPWLAPVMLESTLAAYEWINPPQASLFPSSDFSSKDLHGVDGTIVLQWSKDLDVTGWVLEITQQSHPMTRRCLKCPITGLMHLSWNASDVTDVFTLSSNPLDYVFFFTLSNGTTSVHSQPVNITRPAEQKSHGHLSLEKRATRHRKGLSEQMKWCIGLIAGVGGGIILGIAFVFAYKWSMKRQGRPIVWSDPLPYGGS